jgi:hypothetical protein
MLDARMRPSVKLLVVSAALAAAGCGDKFSAGDGSGEGGEACADGTREAYLGEAEIGACAGAFDVPGVVSVASRTPSCSRQAGNDGARGDGVGCSVADLCAAGFHVCENVSDVRASASAGACPASGGVVFWLTREATDDNGACMTMGQNNLVGCASGLGVGSDPTCAPLDAELRYTHCLASSVWECGSSAAANEEATLVTKSGSNEGGVLCCRD